MQSMNLFYRVISNEFQDFWRVAVENSLACFVVYYLSFPHEIDKKIYLEIILLIQPSVKTSKTLMLKYLSDEVLC